MIVTLTGAPTVCCGGERALKPSLTELLLDYPAFQDMSAYEVEGIVSRGRTCAVAEGRTVFEQGLEVSSFFLLIEGYVRVVKTLPDGQQVIVRYFPTGELIGIAPAMNLSVYPASAIAVVDCILLAWPERLWKQFTATYPAFAANALRLVGQRLQESQTRLVDISTARAERRIAIALLRMGESVGRTKGDGFTIDFPLSRQDLAEMTATTLHTVSRLLAGWERMGLVELGRQKIAVLSRNGLRRLAISEASRSGKTI